MVHTDAGYAKREKIKINIHMLFGEKRLPHLIL
jgi:hypothetical protein